MATYVEVKAANWDEEVKKADVLTVVYFWHNECPWCLRLNPVFNEISDERRGQAKFVKLNILDGQANREIAAKYGVMSTPTIVFFCLGRPIGQAVGFMVKEQLEKLLEDMLQKYRMCLSQSTELRLFYVV